MYLRIIRVVVGSGDTSDAVLRIANDLIPIYRQARGFIAYYVIGAADDTLLTIRHFDDLQTLEEANATAGDASEQIRVDFNLSFADLGEGYLVGYGAP